MDKQKQSEQSNGESGQSVPALKTLSQVTQSQIDAMSWLELDAFVDDGLECVSYNLVHISAARRAIAPAIHRVHEALARQGRRTDLLDAPEKLTFDAWVRNKTNLGSRATLYRLLKDTGTEKAAGLPQRKPLEEGAMVKVKGTSEAGVVTHVHEVDGGEPKVDVRFEGEKKDVTCDAADLVKVTVRKIARGDLFEDERGVKFRYEGGGKFVRTAAPSKTGSKKMCRTMQAYATTKACRTTKSGKAKVAAAGQRI